MSVSCVGSINATAGAPSNDMDVLNDLLVEYGQLPWLWAMFGSMLIGLSGVLPLLIIPIDEKNDLKQGDSANTLKTLLSFAVGGLLGDVFLHSLPEIWANDTLRNGGTPSIYNGVLVLSGLIIFVVVEKISSAVTKATEEAANSSSVAKSSKTSSVEKINNNNIKGYVPSSQPITEDVSSVKRHIRGYLNLFANMIDNFAHGLSVGGAFLVSLRLGCLTTFAILMHEIPHEVGDFAILLKSGFTRWDAARGQLVTAGGGLLGSLVAIVFSGASTSIEARTSWILPLTSGTFLHIALVTVLPELLKEEDPIESLKQLSALLLGIAIMGFIGVALE